MFLGLISALDGPVSLGSPSPPSPVPAKMSTDFMDLERCEPEGSKVANERKPNNPLNQKKCKVNRGKSMGVKIGIVSRSSPINILRPIARKCAMSPRSSPISSRSVSFFGLSGRHSPSKRAADGRTSPFKFLNNDCMSVILTFLSSLEGYRFLSSPLDKSFRSSFTKSSYLWAQLCIGPAFMFDASTRPAVLLGNAHFDNFCDFRAQFMNFVKCEAYVESVRRGLPKELIVKDFEDDIRGRAMEMDVDIMSGGGGVGTGTASAVARVVGAAAASGAGDEFEGEAKKPAPAALSVTTDAASGMRIVNSCGGRYTGHSTDVFPNTSFDRVEPSPPSSASPSSSPPSSSKKAKKSRSIPLMSEITRRLLAGTSTKSKKPLLSSNLLTVRTKFSCLPWTSPLNSLVNWLVFYSNIEGIGAYDSDTF